MGLFVDVSKDNLNSTSSKDLDLNLVDFGLHSVLFVRNQEHKEHSEKNHRVYGNTKHQDENFLGIKRNSFSLVQFLNSNRD